MANVTPSALIGEARGKVGGVVFTRNHHGPIVRGWVNPTQIPSARRTANKANMATLVAAWQSVLTQTQRDAWIHFAAHASPYAGPIHKKHPPGLQQYIRHNFALQLYFTRHDDPPTDIRVQNSGKLIGLWLNSADPLFLVDVEHRPDTHHALIVYASAPQTHGRSSNTMVYYSMDQLTIDDHFPADIYPQYAAFVAAWNLRQPGRHDPLLPTDRVFIKCHMLNLNSGAKSQAFYAYTDNLAPGADAMLMHSVTLTDANIKALPTTPFPVLPAPGPNLMNVIHQVLIDRKTIVAAYTGIDPIGNSPFLIIGEPSGNGLTCYVIDSNATTPNLNQLTSLLSNSTTKWVFTPNQGAEIALNLGLIGRQAYVDTSVNAAATINTGNQVANFTGGNAANTWKVTTFYSIVSV
jgi:hypothetical protein